MPSPIHIFVAPRLDDVYRAVGLDYFPIASGPGNGMGGMFVGPQTVFSGDSRLGEAYLHELVHLIQNKALQGHNGVFVEGIATWLGGTGSFDFRAVHKQIKEFQQTHPDVSIESVLRDEFPTGNTRAGTRVRYGTYGMIVEAVFNQSGMEGLKQLAAMQGNTAVIDALPRLLGLAEGDVTPTMWWRQ